MNVAVVTGAASGVGRGLVARLAADGWHVAAGDIRTDELVRVADELGWPDDRVRCCELDVRDAAAWEALLDAVEADWGPVDLVANVAGVLRPGSVGALDDADVDFHIDVNVKGVIRGTEAAARRMRRRGSGHVVNLGSLASIAPVPGLALYSASKFAVRSFSIIAAYELRDTGVAVTCVCPDAIDTPMLDLQLDHAEAAITFSGPKTFTVDDIVAVLVDDVLVRRPIEVRIPRSRGALATAASAFPTASLRLAPVMRRRGLRRQERLRRRRR